MKSAHWTYIFQLYIHFLVKPWAYLPLCFYWWNVKVVFVFLHWTTKIAIVSFNLKYSLGRRKYMYFLWTCLKRGWGRVHSLSENVGEKYVTFVQFCKTPKKGSPAKIRRDPRLVYMSRKVGMYIQKCQWRMTIVHDMWVILHYHYMCIMSKLLNFFLQGTYGKN